MKHENQTLAGIFLSGAGAWLLTTGFLVIAALVTMAPFIPL